VVLPSASHVLHQYHRSLQMDYVYMNYELLNQQYPNLELQIIKEKSKKEITKNDLEGRR
jgi:hypothetical protein